MKRRWLIAVLMAATLIGCEKRERQQTNSQLNGAPDSIPLNQSPDVRAVLDEPGLANQPPVPASPIPSASHDLDTKHQPSLDELLLFFPSKYPDGNWHPKNLVYEDVWITSDDGTRIHGRYCPCQDPRAYVLYAHGNAGNLSHRAALISYFQNELRVSTLIFDYRGYGRSDGTPTVSGAISDSRAALRMLAEQAGVRESDLVLIGRSLGGAIVIQLAAEFQPRGLVVESSFSSLKQVALHHYPKLAWLVSKNKLNSSTSIVSYRGPLLQSHGTSDRTIPYSSGIHLYKAANEPKRFIEIENSDHNDPMPKTYYNSLSKFIDNLLD